MKVLGATTAGAGHFGPMVPFLRACSGGGHDVRVAAPASFRSSVESAGFAHEPLGEPEEHELGAVFARLPAMSLEESNRTVVREVFAGAGARAALPDMERICHAWAPDLIVRETTEYASYVAAEKLALPHVQVSIGLSTMDDFVTEALDGALDPLGLPAQTDTMAQTLVIRTAPELLDPAGPASHRFRYEVAAPSGELPLERDPEFPLVYATFGTVAAGLDLFPGLYRAVIDGLADHPVQVLMTVGHAGDPSELGPLPANVHVEQFWPQHEVMGHAAATIGHGGFGTTMTSLALGVPLVVLPLFAIDQHFNAEAVAAAGAGVTLEGPDAVGEVPDALDRLLARPEHGDAATAVAEQIAALPPPSAVIPLFEQLGSASPPRDGDDAM